MPQINVKVPHGLDAQAAFARLKPALEKLAKDFQGQDLELSTTDTTAVFSFKSLGFTIKGQAEARADEVAVDVELPFAAMMFKDKAQEAIEKNVRRALETGG
jgi:uncharacterized protein (UPF0303 family)